MYREQNAVGNEIKRKAFHLVGLAIPFAYHFSMLQKEHVVFITSLLLLGSLAVEIIRMRTQPLPIFELTMRRMLRRSEQTTMAAYVYWLAGALATFFFFKKAAATAAITTSLLADTGSAIAGIGVGKHTIPWNEQKSVEGTLVGTLTSLLTTLLFFDFNFTLALIAAALYTLLDTSRIPLDDNLTFPIALGLLYSVGNAFHL